MEAVRLETWDRLRELMATGDATTLDEYLHSLSGAEVLRALFRLDEDEQRSLLQSLTPSVAAEIIEEVPDAHAADLIEGLPASDAASIVGELPSDERADVLGEVEDAELDAILQHMDDRVTADALELMSFPAGSAGGLMVREYLAYSGEVSARIALADIIAGTDDLPRSALQQVYVTGRGGMLLGAVRSGDLVSVAPDTRLDSLLQAPSVINASADLEMLRSCFDAVDALAFPVTSDDGQLKGLLLRSSVEEALIERAEQDHLKSQGIVGGEELRSLPVIHRSRRRLSWLSLNIGLNLIAASVIAAFEDTLTAVIALAVFLPIVSDMSGCSGNQAVAVSMRELTLGIVNVRDVLRVWWQEVQVGLINGLSLGLLLGAAAWAWKGNPVLGLVVGAALGVNTVVAVSIGGTVPLLLKRFGADPAVASGPVLTTVTDVCGFLLVLGIATVALPWLS